MRAAESLPGEHPRNLEPLDPEIYCDFNGTSIGFRSLQTSSATRDSVRRVFTRSRATTAENGRSSADRLPSRVSDRRRQPKLHRRP